MALDPDRYVIHSQRADGTPFRPSDWIERVASALAIYGQDHRLHYSPWVFPAVINGGKCLVVMHGLAEKDPAAFDHVMAFARDNGLRIQEDRRGHAIPVPQERRG